MPEHKDIVDPNIHEPKGVAAASADTVYVATGAGSGTWQKIGAASLDDAELPLVNKLYLTARMDDVANNPSTIYVPIPIDCTCAKISFAMGANLDALTPDGLLTFANNAGATMATQTITSGVGYEEGDVIEVTTSSNNTFTAGEALSITTDGTAEATVAVTAPAVFVIELTAT